MTELKADALLPCPFCGGEAEMTEAKKGQAGCFDPIFDARCSDCDCRTYNWCDTEAEAITAWNTRQQQDRDGLVEELSRLSGEFGEIRVSLSEEKIVWRTAHDDNWTPFKALGGHRD